MTDIEGTAEEVGAELAPVQQPAPAPSTLFRTDDPVEVVEKASRIASALKDVLHRQNMVQGIQGREHIKVEGWVTLGAMLGVVPVVTWTRQTPKGWEARVEARTLDGRVVGAAESMCSRDERRWKQADDYAVRSMAQTRATAKALGGPLRFIVTLAGYEGTPAEEMPESVPGPGSVVGAAPVSEPVLDERAVALVNQILQAWDQLPKEAKRAMPPALRRGKLDQAKAKAESGDYGALRAMLGEVRGLAGQQEKAA